ncbi:very short patch repair endonuclease [Metapseudomonas otitidis]|uniref:very short patch repair endonuclease n=1 Tax=Metapseudomonas otitidis TaxID=319939 RepID=UPI003A8A422F
MTDFLSPEKRSERMSRIRGQNTQPELALRKALHRLGLRYRLHNATLPGKPDLVFPRYKAVVFVHGCFWHSHTNCSIANIPKSNSEFWREKFKKNKERDARVVASLEKSGWHVLIVWECELTNREKIRATSEIIAASIICHKKNLADSTPRHRER